MNSETRNCQNCKKDFTIESDDFLFYEKIKVPAPTFCPECRMQRRMSWRNERSLYRRKCNLCNKIVISRVSSDKEYIVYCQNCWWSDKWDASYYKMDYNFSKSFFDQFKSLILSVPHISLQSANSVNSEYINQESDDKNCYLNFGGHYNEDSAYNTYEVHGKNCYDNYWLFESENCSNNISCENSFNLHFSIDSRNCMDSYFLKDCRNCSHCIGCSGLRNQKYNIFNKRYNKDEYDEFIIKHPLNNFNFFKIIKKQSLDYCLKFPKKNLFIENSSNVVGDYIENSKNSFNIFQSSKVENCKYSSFIAFSRDSFDVFSTSALELSYEIASSGGLYNSKFISNCMAAGALDKVHCYNIEYSFMMVSCSNCFACIGLRNKQYCILNKQYTKEEYEELVPKIIKHMNDMPYIDSKGRVYKYGEFFPSELSPFAYNETIAQEYFPLTKEEALKQGYKWKDKEERNYQIDIKNEDIPDDINDVNEDILGKVIECKNKGDEKTQCAEAFKITPEELQFYKRMKLPIPRLCPNCRHYERLAQRNPMKLWHRTCMKEGCTNEFETSYSPDRPEIVYCEKCYQQEVY